jgi:ABC-2 type transport system ATP-binding protein
MSVLKVQDLKKCYKKGFIPRLHPVLKGVSFTIKSGQITGFLGANGSGKTTTMKCLLGLSFPDSGVVEFFSGQLLDNQVKARIGFLPEHPYFYDYLTGMEFLRFYGELSMDISRSALRDRSLELLRKVGLYAAKDKALREYSKGMLQKVGLAQALIHEPELVILDEPLSGLDPDGRQALGSIIQDTARAGTAVFLSSHLLHDAEKLCDQLVILKDGVVAFEGQTLDLLKVVQQGVEIQSQRDGEEVTETVSDLSQAQKRIDDIRRQGGDILSVQMQQKSLEEAFVDIALTSV